MSQHFEDLHHLSAAYALDALDADERAAYEHHFPSCEICSSDVRLGREVAAELADAVSVPPSPDLKASIIAEVGRTRQISPRVPVRVVQLTERRARPTRAAWIGAAAAAVIVVIGALTVVRPDGSQLDDVIASSDAVVTALDGTGGSVRVVWSPDRNQVAIFANDLADPGPGMAYALWFLRDDGDVKPAGLFRPGDSGTVRTVLDIDDLDTTGWGITIEPDSGSPEPTSDVIFIGEI